MENQFFTEENQSTSPERNYAHKTIMGETSSSDIVSVLKSWEVFTGQKPEACADWLKKFSLLLSFRRCGMNSKWASAKSQQRLDRA